MKAIGKYIVKDYSNGIGCMIYLHSVCIGCIDNVCSDDLDEEMIEDLLFSNED